MGDGPGRASLRVRSVLVVGALAGAVGCGAGSSPTTTTLSAADHVLTDPIYLGGGNESFVPPPAGTTPELDARAAFDAFAGDDREIRDGVDYELGLLTSPPSVTDVLVWGFHPSQPGGCLTTGGVRLPQSGSESPSPSPTAEPPQCIEWDFINADTGRYLLGTSPVVSGPGSDVSSPKPAPGTDELADGGPLYPSMERFSPDELVDQAPESTIRWTFDMANCDIELHGFLPQGDEKSASGSQPCRAAGEFTVDTTAGFTSRGRVFAVVAGHISGPFDAPRNLVRVDLANGDSQTFDPDEDNRAWLFPVQRCGDFAGTVPVEVKYDGTTVMERLPVPPDAFDGQSPTDCGSTG